MDYKMIQCEQPHQIRKLLADKIKDCCFEHYLYIRVLVYVPYGLNLHLDQQDSLSRCW
jgi:hypothetical protein